MTKRVIVILLMTAQKMALLIMAARRSKRGRSVFEPRFGRIVVGDGVQDDCPVDNPVEPRNQYRNKCSTAPSRNAGACRLRDNVR